MDTQTADCPEGYCWYACHELQMRVPIPEGWWVSRSRTAQSQVLQIFKGEYDTPSPWRPEIAIELMPDIRKHYGILPSAHARRAMEALRRDVTTCHRYEDSVTTYQQLLLLLDYSCDEPYPHSARVRLLGDDLNDCFLWVRGRLPEQVANLETLQEMHTMLTHMHWMAPEPAEHAPAVLH